MRQKIIMVLGPTASGKTSFAVRLTDALDGEIISADSRQVYRGFDIGSGKDLAEYRLGNGREVPYHLIDTADVMDGYSLANFLTDATLAIDSIWERGKVPVIAGGTALYLHGLLSTYRLSGGAPDEAAREKLRSEPLERLCEILSALDPACEIPEKEPQNRIRLIRKIELLRGGDPAKAKEPRLPDTRDFLIFGVLRTREEVRTRIEIRLRERLDHGLLEEAVRLHEKGIPWKKLEFLGLEYRYAALHLQGKITREELLPVLLGKIRQFAKRQDSWFRKFERDGFDIHWLRPETEFQKALALSHDFLAGKSIPHPEFRLSKTFYGPKR